MSADIRIPADRIEESRIGEYREGLLPGQYRLKEVIIMMAITSAVMAGVRAVITHADKPEPPVLHSRP